ncbi:hypothetical protein VFPPC_14547 [Pochonia chlamydosporia 170]|uniref:Uncharacterized protein n=1 Tax=Pochonia chlamydosporia 170 TaxID=1380566 RepID=A0A179FDA1_METCM|nr:hypothetical protein VFPPC_14547 [Pochonia chlamydosporia 170]OAQ63280.1 hypothetical protein VFPPC_14547 [Pochonia chlamydosporia 170]
MPKTPIHVEEEKALRGKLMKVLEGESWLQEKWIPKLVTIAGQDKVPLDIWTHVSRTQKDLMQDLLEGCQTTFELSGVLRCTPELLGAFTRDDKTRDAAWDELKSIEGLW